MIHLPAALALQKDESGQPIWSVTYSKHNRVLFTSAWVRPLPFQCWEFIWFWRLNFVSLRPTTFLLFPSNAFASIFHPVKALQNPFIQSIIALLRCLKLFPGRGRVIEYATLLYFSSPRVDPNFQCPIIGHELIMKWPCTFLSFWNLSHCFYPYRVGDCGLNMHST